MPGELESHSAHGARLDPSPMRPRNALWPTISGSSFDAVQRQADAVSNQMHGRRPRCGEARGVEQRGLDDLVDERIP